MATSTLDGGPQDRYVRPFGELAAQVRAAGLMDRRRAYYWTCIAAWVAAFVGVWVAFALLGDSWWQLANAAVLGVVVTQFGFLGHDAAHCQIFAGRRANAVASSVFAGVFAGLSVSWWRAKHRQHHRAPNAEGIDPDIGPGAIAFTPAIVASRRGFAGWFARHQGWLFFPLLTLEGLNLHAASVRSAAGQHRRGELAVLAARLGGYVLVLAVFLPAGLAIAFLAVQMAVFGVCLGASFAPAHKGMPIVPLGMRLDFLRRQVLVSRNVRGNPLLDVAMGGLNYQIEHHLFPSMPRCNFRHAQGLVRAHCEASGVPYQEVGLIESYGIVVRYLNDVGLRARDPFDCPLAAQLRG